MDVPIADARSFGQTHFGHAPLGHKARVKRLVAIADRIAATPRGSLPEKLHDPALYQGMIRLMRHPSTTHHSVLATHLQRTHQRAAAHPGVVLHLMDIVELDFTSRKSLEGLGQIGDGGGRGYECFNVLAVTAQRGEVLGLAAQILHRRADVPKKEGVAAKRQRASRESRLWVKGAEAAGAVPEGRHYVDVADAAADTFEFLEHEHRHSRRYVIRSCHNRAMLPGHDGEGATVLLHDYARTLPPGGWRTVSVGAHPATAEHPAQPARTARVRVSFGAVRLLAPHVKRGEHGNAPLAVWVVRVWEPEPPAGVEALEWVLLTNAPVAKRKQAWERADWYGRRAIVEEYHKAQKTGCGIENPQFTTTDRLEPMIALLSVTACLLVGLRDLGKDESQRTRPAAEVVPVEWVEVLSQWRYGAPRADLTVEEFLKALGRLGGHMNRRLDGLPGWQTLWKGWVKLQTALEFKYQPHPPKN